jgi:hypothetical protein
VVFNFDRYIGSTPFIYPFNFFTFLNDSLDLTKQIFVQNPANDTLIGSAKFLDNGQLNFMAGNRQIANPQYYQLNFFNTFEGAATEAFCNAIDSLHGSFEPHRFIANDVSFHFDSIKTNVYSTDVYILPPVSSFSLLSSEGCKKYSICDSLKLMGPLSVCLNPLDTFKYSFYKNPQCLKETNWKFDTSFAVFTGMINDTILSFKFKKEGRTTISVGLSGCILKDSIIINIGSPKTNIKIMQVKDLCPGGEVILRASTGFPNYTWQDGSTADSLIVMPLVNIKSSEQMLAALFRQIASLLI